ncbi:hypothetical protein SDC9_169944 [bioreactor metagenome]|uniref:Uncharacterized protein n=1 Tax=bioreactor metagenome TaxID=1076179 RepID=A0A645G6P7_9ZZZZ
MFKIRIFQRMAKVVLLEEPVEEAWDSEVDVDFEEEWECASEGMYNYLSVRCFAKKD